jgi:hypothetical protein
MADHASRISVGLFETGGNGAGSSLDHLRFTFARGGAWPEGEGGGVALLVLVVADAQAAVAEFWALVLEGSSYRQSRTLELMAEPVWKACVQVLPQSLIEDAPLALPSGASARVAAIQALHGCQDSHQIRTQVRRPMN